MDHVVRKTVTFVVVALVSFLAVMASGAYARASQPARVAASSGPMMGPQHRAMVPEFLGYYDAHKDTYLSTDLSNKAEARAMHVNFAPSLAHVHGLPAIYVVRGRRQRTNWLCLDPSRERATIHLCGKRSSFIGRARRSRCCSPVTIRSMDWRRRDTSPQKPLQPC